MPYTLTKFLLWFGLAAVIGFAIGWALRSVDRRARRRSGATGAGADGAAERDERHAEELRVVTAERDRLRILVAELRATDSPGIVGADPAPDDGLHASRDDADGPDDGDASTQTPSADSDDGDAADAGHVVRAVDTEEETVGGDDAGDGEPTISDATISDPPVSDVTISDPPISDPTSADVGSDPDVSTDDVSTDGAPASDGSMRDEDPLADPLDAMMAPDVVEGARILGRRVRLDDLAVVEGIGPKISEICRSAGIETWRQLADTEVGELRRMLDAAGPRYAVHRPDTWPRQAALLADGRWTEFQQFLDEH